MRVAGALVRNVSDVLFCTDATTTSNGVPVVSIRKCVPDVNRANPVFEPNTLVDPAVSVIVPDCVFA